MDTPCPSSRMASARLSRDSDRPSRASVARAARAAGMRCATVRMSTPRPACVAAGAAPPRSADRVCRGRVGGPIGRAGPRTATGDVRPLAGDVAGRGRVVPSAPGDVRDRPGPSADRPGRSSADHPRVIDHGEQQLDRDQHGQRRPPGERFADRVRAAYRDVRGEARGGADDQRHPRNPTGRPPGATLRHQVQAGHDLQPVHADRERVRLPTESGHDRWPTPACARS